MGALKVRIALNHYNGQRPLYSGTNKIHTKKEDNAVGNNTMIDKTVNISSSLARGKPINFNES